MEAPYRPANEPKTTRLTLNTIKNTRRTMGRIIRKYFHGEIDQSLFRAVIYGLSQYLAAFRVEKDEALEKRLDEIERKLEE